MIAPNQRGYGHYEDASPITTSLAGDLVGLLDHFGYEDACFVGHLGRDHCLESGDDVSSASPIVINLSVPFMERGTSEWVGFWEKMLGPDFYIVHFNRQPGVADAVFENHTGAVSQQHVPNQSMAAPQTRTGPRDESD